jgi:hypothetical protein
MAMMDASEASAKMGAHMTAPEPAAKVATANVTTSEATSMAPAAPAAPAPMAPPAASRIRSSRKQAAGEGG